MVIWFGTVKGTNFAWFWVTGTVLSDTEILGMVEFDEAVNGYNGRLHFALYLGADDFLTYLDEQNYNDFVKFHNFFWNEIAYLADDD